MLLVLFALACAPPKEGDTGWETDGGPGGRAELVLGPDVLDFGLVIAGATEERIISVRNVGTRDADLTVRVDVDLPQAFTVSPETLTVAADDYENVTFTFLPEAWAVFSGFAVFSEDGEDLASAELSIEVMADRDEDGWGAERHGGGDCDDDDPTIHPEADDTWYDGIDTDCDGRSDFDADGDGYDAPGGEGELDCDDTDPERSPGHAEVWYDGVDTDCDGADDFDADGDGDRSAEHGGTDCLDDDPRLSGLEASWGCLSGVVPAARSAELAGAGDGVSLVDLDGDGQLDLLAVDAELGLVVALGPVTAATDLGGAPAWTGGGASSVVTGDLDGDAALDAVLVDGATGAVRTLRGPLETGGTLATGGTKLRTPGAADRPVVAGPMGDLDGDGAGDVAVGWSGRVGLPGLPPAVMLFTDGDADRDALLLGPPGSAAGAALLGPGDLDGDGHDDLLVGAPAGDGRVWLVSGPVTGGLELADQTARLTGTAGQGLGDGLAWADGGVWVRAGDTWHAVGGAWSGTVSLDGAQLTRAAGAFAPADADADGTPDALLGMPADDAVAWLPALAGDAGTAPLRIDGAGAGIGGSAAVGDLDGDGHPDLVLAAPGLGATLLMPGPVLSP